MCNVVSVANVTDAGGKCECEQRVSYREGVGWGAYLAVFLCTVLALYNFLHCQAEVYTRSRVLIQLFHLFLSCQQLRVGDVVSVSNVTDTGDECECKQQ